MKVVVGSANPVKVESVRRGFDTIFSPDPTRQVIGIEAPSLVKVQPIGEAETKAGALNRVAYAYKSANDVDYAVGIEGGVQTDKFGRLVEVAFIIVTTLKMTTISSTPPFWIPPAIAHMIKNGQEFGPASDTFFGTENSKQKMGTIGLLSDGKIDRTDLYFYAVCTALIPFLHPEYYKD